MKRTLRHASAGLVALYGGVWVAVAPVVPELHQAFARHRHVFCGEHHRIEDVEPTRETFAPVVSTAYSVVGADRSKPRGARPACVFSAFALPPSLRPAVLEWLTASVRVAGFGSPTHAVPWCRALLRVAPKHSPPVA